MSIAQDIEIMQEFLAAGPTRQSQMEPDIRALYRRHKCDLQADKPEDVLHLLYNMDSLIGDDDPHVKMRPIRVCFADPTHNYETTVNGTRKEVEDYFVGSRLDVGCFPEESMATVERIEFL